jgi:uncharacterized protein (TIGR00296 family)
METQLTAEERDLLLKLARQALQEAICEGRLLPLGPEDLARLPVRLSQPGATFVTLTQRGNLRGCIGALEPYQPLAEDVRQHAVDAALNDYRFPPVRPDELVETRIEISYRPGARF